jgi:hypothetical protein
VSCATCSTIDGRRRFGGTGGNQINRIKSRITFQFVRIHKISFHLQLEFAMVGDPGVQQLISNTTEQGEGIVCLELAFASCTSYLVGAVLSGAPSRLRGQGHDHLSLSHRFNRSSVQFNLPSPLPVTTWYQVAQVHPPCPRLPARVR